MLNFIETRAARFLALSAVLAGSLGSASAAVYVGRWDPGYGAPFDALGWRGEATFEIPDACLTGSGFINNGASCSAGGMKVLSAEVDFYDINDEETVVETLTFDPMVLVYGMRVVGNQLAGVSTNFFAPELATSAIAGIGTVDYFFHLKFFEGQDVSEGSRGVRLFHTPDGSDPTCAFNYQGSPNFNPMCGFSATIATVRFSPIPEPQTYALLFAALGAIGLVSGRRRR